MRKTFIRTTSSDGHLHCSWYDKNGKRRKIEEVKHSHGAMTIRATDDTYGYMAYAKQNSYTIIDDAPMPHPTRITE